MLTIPNAFSLHSKRHLILMVSAVFTVCTIGAAGPSCNAPAAPLAEVPQAVPKTVPQTPKSILVEAESGELTGAVASSQGSGFSGTGFVTNLTHEGDKMVMKCEAAAGLYTAKLHYRATMGDKGYVLAINDKRTSGMIQKTNDDAFHIADLGLIELQPGTNTIAIEKGWGYYEVDAIEFVPAKPAVPPQKPPRKLVDAAATPATKALMNRLIDNYGNTTLSGQQGIDDSHYIEQTISKTPAILADDLMEYSPSRVEHGAKPEGHTERIIGEVKKGSILSLCWHWNAPSGLIDKEYVNSNGNKINGLWYRGFYTDATTFDVAAAMDHPESPQYKLLLRDIDSIAVELKKLDKENIPVLWRPLHEASGGWFWWGAKGPKPFKQLWHLMYDRLTKTHKLHNLIWVFTADNKSDWYPGDQYVDIVGVDAYPPDSSDPLSGTWNDMVKQYGGKKLLTLSEFGKVPDIDKMRRYGVYWAYFCSWGGELGPRAVPKDELNRLYSQTSVTNSKPIAATQTTTSK